VAKFSVSIPDEQKSLLDSYAAKNHLGASAVVQKALEAFLGVWNFVPTFWRLM
jgi:hypothetical protein